MPNNKDDTNAIIRQQVLLPFMLGPVNETVRCRMEHKEQPLTSYDFCARLSLEKSKGLLFGFDI